MWNFISHKCSFYVVYFSGLKYPLNAKFSLNAFFQRADEATYEQGGEHLLLPSATVVPTPELCNPKRNVASCDITRPTLHRQLQLCPHQPSNVNDHTSTACSSEYHCPSCPWSETLLATCLPPHYL